MPRVGHAHKAAGDSTVVYGPLVTKMEVGFSQGCMLVLVEFGTCAPDWI